MTRVHYSYQEGPKVPTHYCVPAAIFVISMLATAILTALACAHTLPVAPSLLVAPPCILTVGALATIAIFAAKEQGKL